MESLLSKYWQETKKTWHIAGPAILASVFQFSIGFVTTAFAGHLGSVQLAAVAVAQNVTEGFAYGIMVLINIRVIYWLLVLSVHRGILLNGNLLFLAVRDGKCLGNPLWPSCGRRATLHTRNLHAKVMRHNPCHSRGLNSSLCIHSTNPETAAPTQWHFRSSRQILHLDHPATVCLCPQFSPSEIFPISEKGVGHYCHLWDSSGLPHPPQLGICGEAWPWISSSCHGWECLVVAHRLCTDDISFIRMFSRLMDRVFCVGIPKPVFLLKTFTCLGHNAVVGILDSKSRWNFRIFSLTLAFWLQLGALVLQCSDHSSRLLEESRNCS